MHNKDMLQLKQNKTHEDLGRLNPIEAIDQIKINPPCLTQTNVTAIYTYFIETSVGELDQNNVEIQIKLPWAAVIVYVIEFCYRVRKVLH